MKMYNVLLTAEQRATVTRMGGAKWLRHMIDNADDWHDENPEWSTKEERDSMIANDIRTRLVVAKAFGISPSSVDTIRREAKDAGRPYAVKTNNHSRRGPNRVSK